MLPHDGDAIAIMGNIVLPGRVFFSSLLTPGVNREHKNTRCRRHTATQWRMAAVAARAGPPQSGGLRRRNLPHPRLCRCSAAALCRRPPPLWRLRALEPPPPSSATSGGNYLWRQDFVCRHIYCRHCVADGGGILSCPPTWLGRHYEVMLLRSVAPTLLEDMKEPCKTVYLTYPRGKLSTRSYTARRTNVLA
jgi:hypothetical protein